jgi:hypothetical protein
MGETIRNIVLHDIAAERERQVAAEGFDETHDDAHRQGELAAAAACYATHAAVFSRALAAGVPFEQVALLSDRSGVPQSWPWDPAWWKPRTPEDSLLRAAALIVAELERIERARPDRRPFNE